MERTSRGQNIFTSLPPTAYLYAFVLAVCIWTIETLLEKYIFGFQGTFLKQLISPGIHEFYMRSMFVALAIVIIFLVYVLVRHRRVEEALNTSEENYLNNYMLQSAISAVLEQSLESVSLKEQLGHILDIVLGNPLFGNESRGCIFLYDEKNSRLKIEADREMPEGIKTKCSSLELGQCLCGKAASGREIIFADHIDERHEIHYHDISPHGQYCVPILSADRLLGVLTFYVKTGHQRTREEDSFLLSIAHAIAGVIERKKTELSLQSSEIKFHSLFNQASDSIFLLRPVDNDLIIEDVNDAACRIHGYTREELLGNSIGMLDDPATRKSIPERVSLLLRGKTLHAEAMHVRKDRSAFPVEIMAQRVQIGDNHYILATDRDITSRKKTESALNQRMKLSEMSADIGIAFTTSVSLQDSLQKCSESIVRHLDALFVRIWLFDKNERVLALKASAGLYTHLDGPHSFIPYGKYKIGKIAESQTPHFTNHVLDDPLINDQEWVKKERIVSFAGHPLMLKNKLIGVLAMFSRNALPEITEKALTSVADQISIGIDQKIKEDQVLQAKEQWETTFDTIPDIVIVIDRNHRIRRANRALADKLGIDREQIIGTSCYSVVHGTSEPPSYCPHMEVLSHKKEQVVEMYEDNLNGHFQFSATPILDSLGNVISTVHVARDITRRKRMEEKLQEAAITDILTGLLNRRGFLAMAEQQCRLSDRTKRGITLLFIDLDGMKTINDELGHSAGDQALKDISTLLKHSFRGSDIIARMGGDEFAVLLTEPSEGAEPAVISHLIRNISDHNEHAGRDYELMISIGISHYNPSAPCSIEDMLMKADSRMYQDKVSHKNTVSVASWNTAAAERRNYVRRIVHDRCFVRLADQEGRTFEHIAITNISAGGVCIRTPDRLTEGNVYHITFYREKTKEINTHVRVAWTSPDSADNGKTAVHQFNAGLMFEAMDSALQKQLVVFLEAISGS
ncbi:MAG: diguanylate cyclase [Nitrospiraceae bacterium]|nr:MAG: diguanylate cyclase [Nitrospiraceae bacterium]